MRRLHLLPLVGFFHVIRESRTTPTHYEYAVLCQQTYKEKGERRPPSDWRVVHSRCHATEMGFAATTYQNDEKKAVVIAFRGSQNRWNWIATNPFLIFSQLPSTFGYAEIHTKESIERAPKGYHVSTTGHSLGAVISEITAARFRIPAVTFESPGSKHIIEADKARSQHPDEADITTYLAAPNPVNTLNPQSAQAREKLFRLYIPHLSEDERYARRVMALNRVFFYLNPAMALNPAYWIFYDVEKIAHKGVELVSAPSWVLRQHDINNIVDQFDPKTGELRRYEKVISWPSCLSNTVVSALLLAKPTHWLEFIKSEEITIESSILLIPGYKVESDTMDLIPPLAKL